MELNAGFRHTKVLNDDRLTGRLFESSLRKRFNPICSFVICEPLIITFYYGSLFTINNIRLATMFLGFETLVYNLVITFKLGKHEITKLEKRSISILLIKYSMYDVI